MRQTMTPDVNVLLAASRSDHPQHAIALRWLTEAVAECDTGGTLEILPMVAAGFLRLSTHPKIFKEPTPIKVATNFIDSLLAIPGVVMPELGREWSTLRRLSVDGNLSANEIPDAWIAACVKTLDSHLVTFDRDFLRLLSRSELTVLVPLE
jgi:uncharacterized protein